VVPNHGMLVKGTPAVGTAGLLFKPLINAGLAPSGGTSFSHLIFFVVELV